MDEQRDLNGTHPGAPGWVGDLRTASPAALEMHGEGLERQIANLTVKYQSADRHTPWRVSTAEERRAGEMERWVERLVQVRTEAERRFDHVGGFHDYSALRETPEWEAPWAEGVPC